MSISCGDPQRTKAIAALYGNKKSDPIEAHACARYAVVERPAATPAPPARASLRQVAGRLQAVVPRARWINQFHHLLR